MLYVSRASAMDHGLGTRPFTGIAPLHPTPCPAVTCLVIVDKQAKDFCLCKRYKDRCVRVQVWYHTQCETALFVCMLCAVFCLRNRGPQPWQDLLADVDTLLDVREAGEDELIDAQTPVGQQFVYHLLRCANNCRATVNAHC